MSLKSHLLLDRGVHGVPKFFVAFLDCCGAGGGGAVQHGQPGVAARGGQSGVQAHRPLLLLLPLLPLLLPLPASAPPAPSLGAPQRYHWDHSSSRFAQTLCSLCDLMVVVLTCGQRIIIHFVTEFT